MRTVIVLALRGAGPADFPQAEMGELLEQHAQLEQAAGPGRAWFERRPADLETCVRAGSRSAGNDPFHVVAHDLGDQLSRVTGCEVVVGFDHFGVPSLEDALEQAAISAKQVFVITPTSPALPAQRTAGLGGLRAKRGASVNRTSQFSKVELPRAIRSAQARHFDTPIVYLWGFDVSDLAAFLAGPMERQFEQTRIPWESEARPAGWRTGQTRFQGRPEG